MQKRIWVHLAQVAIVLWLLATWEWGFMLNERFDWLVPDILDPYFVSQPSEIWERFLSLACFTDINGVSVFGTETGFTGCLARTPDNLWAMTWATLYNTFWGFVVGVGSGVLIGLVLGRYEGLARIFEPFIIAVNSLPRIALVPLIVLMFGLGDLSKVMTAWVIVFFLVFFNTYEGARSVDRDHINAARLLGASDWQITRTVVVPSTMAWVFASLTPAVSFSLIGVIVGEFIGAEKGLGKVIIEAEATLESADMMVALFVLMVVGVALALGIRRVQAYLLRWQAHFHEVQ